MFFAKVIDSKFSTVLQDHVARRAEKMAARMMANPALGPAIERELSRQEQRFMSNELGMPMKTRYRDVYEFVDEVVLDLYPAQLSNEIRWCAKWWAHPAAVRRLTMMWASWETHRAENPATGEESWARFIGDYHFRWLTGPYSPFIRCSDTKHAMPPSLPSDPIPMTNPTADNTPAGAPQTSEGETR